MKLRIVQRTQDRVWGCATAPLDDGEAEFIAGSPSADFEECPGLLDNLPSGRTVLQEFRPLPESLDWELGHCFWQHLGVQSFLGGRVPYRVTNDGNLSRKAATVLFDSLSAVAAGQPTDPKIRVLELGAGSGLFARHFLDEFQALCRERGRDYYDRLLYLVTDASTRMRADLARHGVLSAHEGRYRIEAANAEAPGFGLSNSVVRETDGEGKFHAVILNYVLDCLPATVLKVSDGEVSELFVRTSLARNVDLAAHTSMNAEELVACARSADPAERTRLLELYPLFALEHQYRSAARERIPFAAQAVETAGPDEGVVLHNHGALLCLERVLTLLAPGGFALINDYDDSPFDEFVQSYRHQHFGGSVAFGLNQALLRKHFSARDDCQWIETAGENRPLASRLLARDPDPTTVRAFRRCFSTPAHDWHSSPIEQARGFAKAGRRESALTAYRSALRRQPGNWALLAEVAEFLLFTVRDYPAALNLAEAGLELNPLSPELWNIKGDGLYYLGRDDDAHAAFLRALDLAPNNVRARYNLSFTLARRHEAVAALRLIGEGLALDRGDHYRDRLLRQQGEILDQLRRAREIESRCLADRWLPADP